MINLWRRDKIALSIQAAQRRHAMRLISVPAAQLEIARAVRRSWWVALVTWIRGWFRG